jgi:transcription elongation factor GreA
MPKPSPTVRRLQDAGRIAIVRKERRPAAKQRPGAGILCFPGRWVQTMIERLKLKLGEEVEKLRYELNVTLPAEINRAVEMGDLRENSEYKAALERQRLVQARLGMLMMRLSKLAQIDIAQIPPDKVGLGSKIVVEDQDSKERETYHLVFGDSIEFEDGHVTMSSPIGRAMLNKAKGDLVVLKLPARTRRLVVMELVTIHDATPADLD